MFMIGGMDVAVRAGEVTEMLAQLECGDGRLRQRNVDMMLHVPNDLKAEAAHPVTLPTSLMPQCGSKVVLVVLEAAWLMAM